MSQIGKFFNSGGGGGGPILTLTGDSGGAVAPDGVGNIDVVGGTGITTTGNPGTNTITIDVDGTIPDQFDTDAGSAIPALGILNILGGTGIGTTGAGNTVTINVDGTIPDQFDGNVGSAIPALGILNIQVNHATLPAYFDGSTVNFYASANNVLLSFTDDADNTGVGFGALASVTAPLCDNNTAFGFACLNALDTGINNTAIGSGAGLAATGAENNTIVGTDAAMSLTTGNANVIIGVEAGNNLLTGVGNLIIGAADDTGAPVITSAGTNYVAAESNNICIGNPGTLGDNNTIRIGTTGVGPVQQSNCYIGGISGVDVGNVVSVVSISGDHLGEVDIVGTGGITVTPTANTITIDGSGAVGVLTVTGNTGGAISPAAGNINIVTANATPVFAGAGSTETLDFNLTNLVLGSSLPALAGGVTNVGMGSGVLAALTSGVQNVAVGYQAATTLNSASNNTYIGYLAGTLTTTGSGNTYVGGNAGLSTSTGTSNTAVGQLALSQYTTGAANAGGNVAVGNNALGAVTTGTVNTAIGTSVAALLLTGTNNHLFGNGTGSAYTTSESSNILISNTGVVGESNKIRIGTTGSGAGQQNAAYIAGIDGVNVGSVATVVTESGDQLGTAVITAGTNTTVTPGANTITIGDSQAQILPNYSVANASPYVVAATDFYITVDTSTIPITIQLPDAPTTYRYFIIKDSAGNAATQNVTVTTVSGVINIDAAPTFVMNTDWEAIQLVYDGFGYQVF